MPKPYKPPRLPTKSSDKKGCRRYRRQRDPVGRLFVSVAEVAQLTARYCNLEKMEADWRDRYGTLPSEQQGFVDIQGGIPDGYVHLTEPDEMRLCLQLGVPHKKGLIDRIRKGFKLYPRTRGYVVSVASALVIRKALGNKAASGLPFHDHLF